MEALIGKRAAEPSPEPDPGRRIGILDLERDRIFVAVEKGSQFVEAGLDIDAA
ncbi:hypothetical protein D3C71_1915650 [compost metagenome]